MPTIGVINEVWFMPVVAEQNYISNNNDNNIDLYSELNTNVS